VIGPCDAAWQQLPGAGRRPRPRSGADGGAWWWFLITTASQAVEAHSGRSPPAQPCGCLQHPGRRCSLGRNPAPPMGLAQRGQLQGGRGSTDGEPLRSICGPSGGLQGDDAHCRCAVGRLVLVPGGSSLWSAPIAVIDFLGGWTIPRLAFHDQCAPAGPLFSCTKSRYIPSGRPGLRAGRGARVSPCFRAATCANALTRPGCPGLLTRWVLPVQLAGDLASAPSFPSPDHPFNMPTAPTANKPHLRVMPSRS